jgi:hypothetical protein
MPPRKGQKKEEMMESEKPSACAACNSSTLQGTQKGQRKEEMMACLEPLSSAQSLSTFQRSSNSR